MSVVGADCLLIARLPVRWSEKGTFPVVLGKVTATLGVVAVVEGLEVEGASGANAGVIFVLMCFLL
jgi:hypothetical protein